MYQEKELINEIREAIAKHCLTNDRDEELEENLEEEDVLDEDEEDEEELLNLWQEDFMYMADHCENAFSEVSFIIQVLDGKIRSCEADFDITNSIARDKVIKAIRVLEASLTLLDDAKYWLKSIERKDYVTQIDCSDNT